MNNLSKLATLKEHASQLFANMFTFDDLQVNDPQAVLEAYIQVGEADEYSPDNFQAVHSAWLERWKELESIYNAPKVQNTVLYGLFSNFDPTGFQFHRVKIVHLVSDKGEQYVAMHPAPPTAGEWVFEVFETERQRENRILELQ